MENFYLILLVIFARPLTLLQAQIPAIVKAIHKQLREKSFKTRQVNSYESCEIKTHFPLGEFVRAKRKTNLGNVIGQRKNSPRRS
jgi:hypothetical protein